MTASQRYRFHGSRLVGRTRDAASTSDALNELHIHLHENGDEPEEPDAEALEPDDDEDEDDVDDEDLREIRAAARDAMRARDLRDNIFDREQAMQARLKAMNQANAEYWSKHR